MKIPNSFKKTAKYLWHEWAKPLVVMAVIILPIKSSIADWNWVPTGSMKPTIMEGDLVFINKLAYDLKVPFSLSRISEWGNPKNGDIVVFFSPKDGMRLVKRVIACPGDTIEMKDNVLFLNGDRMQYSVSDTHSFSSEIYEDARAVLARESQNGTEHWVMSLPARPAMRSFSRLTVPPGKYFMMGDSRDNSADSRFFGFVDRKQIIGQASRVLLSFDKNHYYIPRIQRIFSTLNS